jgi:ABC-2 type transport system ATP-binding protein
MKRRAPSGARFPATPAGTTGCSWSADMQGTVIPMPAGRGAGANSSGVARDDEAFAVRARSLTKHYRHPWTLRVVRGLEGLDLAVRRGEVFGYLGPNGAGKTTTLKLLCGLHRPTAGDAWLFGVPIRDPASRRRIGFLPEHPYFYDHLSGVEYLEFAARLSGLAAREAQRRARHWIGRVGLGASASRSLRKYSKGMLQRIGLAAALVHDPDLLILDEPMSGLDPFGRRDVRDLILEQRERGVTVLFSSHILPDVEMICDRVAILLAGRLERVATVGEIVAGGAHAVEIRCAGVHLVSVPPAWQEIVGRREHPHETVFMVQDETRTTEVLAWLLGQGIEVRAVTPHRPSLEEMFMAAAERARLGSQVREARP